MPEGDTIFRTARSLGRALIGKPVTVFRSTYPLLTRFNDETPIPGQLIEHIEARGKWLLIRFSGGGILVTHMLMNGSWHIYRHGERWQQPRFNMRIVIENNDFVIVGFRVPVAEMHTAQSLSRDRRIPTSEIDVLSPEFKASVVTRRIQAHASEEIADVLLHQEVLAGVGNEFKSEICFVTGINPFARVSALTPDQLQSLISTTRRLVRANILEDSGDTMLTYSGRGRRTTHQSDPTERVWVYGRKAEPCRKCGDLIRRRIQGPDARVTFWCQRCQPMPDGSNVDG